MRQFAVFDIKELWYDPISMMISNPLKLIKHIQEQDSQASSAWRMVSCPQNSSATEVYGLFEGVG